ncbi:MAG: hypothetical protein RL748_3442 [Pseudomonadota bacterium]
MQTHATSGHSADPGHAPAMRSLQEAITVRQNGFNLIRLIAALLVVVFHVWQLNVLQPNSPDPLTAWLGPDLNLGTLAVALFFMISGLFITQSWINDPHLLRFSLRRVMRIVPGLLVCLLLTTLLAVSFFSAAGLAGMLRADTWHYILSNSVLHGLQLIIPPEATAISGVLQGEKLNGPLWTLYWEGRMYVMVALLGCLAWQPLRRWFAWAALFLILSASLFPSVLNGYVWEVRLWSMFLTGMLLFTLAGSVRIGWHQVLAALVLIVLNWSGFMALDGHGLRWFTLVLFLGLLSLKIGTQCWPGLAHLQKHDYSYAIYIYHWPVILLLRASLPPLGPLNLLLCTLLVLIPLAMVSWHWVEAPMLRLGQGWIGKLRKP